MDIQLFRTFLLVVELGNVTHAAEQLNFTQPTITAQIKTLEETFGVCLFERIGKKLYITAAGKNLVAEAKKLLSVYDELQESMQAFSVKNDPVKIGASTVVASYILSPVLREFQDSQINGSVIVDICATLPVTIKGLLDNAFDLAIVHDKVDASQLLQFELSSQKLVWVALADLVAKNNHRLDLHQYPFINFKEGCVYRTKCEEFLKEAHINTMFEYSDAEAIKQAVLDGLGISLLPYALVEPYLSNGTVVEFTDAPQLSVTISVVLHKDKSLSPVMQALLLILAQHADKPNQLLVYLQAKAQEA